MIYTFTWNSKFLISESVSKWKKQFSEKYWEINLIHLKDLEKIELNILKENILSENLFAEKKLIIIDLEDKKSDNEEEKEDNFFSNILKILEKKPENNIVIFSYFSPDKRKKFYKNLIKISEVKEFNLVNDKFKNDTKNFLLSKYNWKIDENALDLLIRFKANNLEKIISEMEKLLILKNFITKEDIEKNIVPELEESIFDIIDLLLKKEKILSVQKIWTLLNNINIFLFLNTLISNLRTNLYIFKLKKQKIPKQKISEILDLGKRSFIIDKNYKISFEEFKNFYISMVNIDKNMKTWKMISSEEEDIKREVEKCILKI